MTILERLFIKAIDAIFAYGDDRVAALFDCPRAPYEPDPPTSTCCLDVMCVLPDGRRGFFDGVCLWSSTGTTIHSRNDAESTARDLRRDYGDRARFYVVDAAGGDYEPICTIDGGPAVIAECERCGYRDVNTGPVCRACREAEEDAEEQP